MWVSVSPFLKFTGAGRCMNREVVFMRRGGLGEASEVLVGSSRTAPLAPLKALDVKI